MQKWDFKTYQKRLWDFEILLKFSETHIFRGTIRHPFISQKCNIRYMHGSIHGWNHYGVLILGIKKRKRTKNCTSFTDSRQVQNQNYATLFTKKDDWADIGHFLFSIKPQ